MTQKQITRRQFAVATAGLAVTGCAPRLDFFENTHPNGGQVQKILLATNRRVSSTGPQRTNTAAFSLLMLETTEGRAPGALDFAGEKAFSLLAEEPVTRASLRSALAQSNNAAKPQDGALMVWVHGFNNTPGEAVARQAQIIEDVGHIGPAVSFVWPSRAAGNGYVFDRDSALHARKILAETLVDLRAAWSGPIVLMAHSLGGFLTMEALARLRLTGRQGDVVDGLILVQPDIAPDVFATQIADAGPLPQRTILMISQVDPALRLSSRISGQTERLGSTAEPDLYRNLGIEVIDLTDVRDATNPHLAAFTSPTVLAQLRAFVANSRATALVR